MQRRDHEPPDSRFPHFLIAYRAARDPSRASSPPDPDPNGPDSTDPAPTDHAPPTSARRTCAAAILAGGRAPRLHGADKSALVVGGRPILARQLEAIDGLVDDVFVVGGAPAPGLPDVERIADRAPGHGPLGGIQAALHRAGAAACTLIVACDLPFLSRPFLAHLLARALDREAEVDVVVPRRDDRLHPLCAAYNRRVREAVDRRVDAGVLAVQALFDELRVDVVGPEAMAAFDPDGVMLWNVNTPEEYERACARAAMG